MDHQKKSTDTKSSQCFFPILNLKLYGVFIMVKKSIAIITGASSGLGREFVWLLDQSQEIDEIWLAARRENRLREIAEQLTHKTVIVAGDVTDPDWLSRLEQKLADENLQIDTLINSAGIGKIGTFSDIGLDTNALMVEVNVLALTKICSVCLPYLKKGGRILNVASVAAFLPQANFAVYAATKAYVLSLSRALNKELHKFGATVTAVCPNPMETEFFNFSGRKEKAQAIKNLGLEEPEKVARVALRKSAKGKDISVSSFISRLVRFSSRIFPHPFILWLEEKIGL